MPLSAPSPEAALQEILSLLQTPPAPSGHPPVACPICILTERSVQSALGFFFAEFVNDPEMRVSLRAAKGFCAEHTRSVHRAGDALAIAILYSDLADQTLLRWKERPPIGKPSPLASLRRSQNASAPPCPACQHANETETRYVRALAQNLAQPALANALAQNSGLCVAHVEAVARNAKPDAARPFLEQERRRLEALYEELSEVIRKNDYRFRGEPWGDEKDSWQRAMMRLQRPRE